MSSRDFLAKKNSKISQALGFLAALDQIFRCFWLLRDNFLFRTSHVGQFGEAIDYWKGAIANYRKLGDFVKVGRLLTELEVRDILKQFS